MVGLLSPQRQHFRDRYCYLDSGTFPITATRGYSRRQCADGDWKLIRFFEDGPEELYNLKEDIGEAKNLADHMVCCRTDRNSSQSQVANPRQLSGPEKGAIDVANIPDVDSATLFRYGNCL